MMNTLKELFRANQEMEIYQRSKELFHTTLKDDGSVSTHVLSMIKCIRYLEGQGIIIDDRLGRNLILSSLLAYSLDLF